MRYAVVLPGSGSTADFVTRAFGPPLAAAGYALVAVDPPTGPDAVAEAFRALDAASRRDRPELARGLSPRPHPLAVAREWTRLLPRAGLRTLALAGVAADRAVLGGAALSAWREAAGSTAVAG